MLYLVVGSKNKNGKVVSEFIGGSREENLLVQKFNRYDVESVEENLEILDSLEFKFETNESSIQMLGFPKYGVAKELVKRLNLAENDVFEGQLFSVEVKATMEEYLQIMIDNPLNKEEEEKKEFDERTLLVSFLEGTDENFAYSCIDIAIYEDESGKKECHLNTHKEDEDGVCYNRMYNFDLYGDEMLPYNHFVAKDKLFQVMEAIANITNHKYTFHKFGDPVLTISKNGIKEWN